MTLAGAFDVLSAVLILCGAALALAASIGIVRFPDVLSRMHAATKPQVLGMLLVLTGTAIQLRNSVDVWMLVLTGAFQLTTAPVAAHLVGRLAYRTRHIRRDLLLLDEIDSSPPSTRP